MCGWFCCAIGAAAGGRTGGFPPGGGCSAEVGANGIGTDGDAVPLGFLVNGSCASNLLAEDIEEVCMGHEELLEALVLGSGMGMGHFPLDTGSVET